MFYIKTCFIYCCLSYGQATELFYYVSDSHSVRMIAPAALTFRREELQNMRKAHVLQFLSVPWHGEAARLWTASKSGVAFQTRS